MGPQFQECSAPRRSTGLTGPMETSQLASPAPSALVMGPDGCLQVAARFPPSGRSGHLGRTECQAVRRRVADMADGEPTSYREGMTALVVAVPEAEPIVGCWRSQYDRSAASGAPAHVTVLFPFLDLDRIDAAVVVELRRIFAAHPAFDIEFHRTGRQPDLVYLSPEPAGPFSRIIQDVVTRWPQCPPYGGKYPDTPPHLTVALRQPDHVLDQISRDLSPHLPFSATVSRIDLVGFDGRSWNLHTSFHLGR